MEVLYPVLTIFVLMLLGYSSVKLKVLDSKAISNISTLVLFFAQPCLILSKMQPSNVTPQLLGELGVMFVLTCVVMGASGWAAWMIFKKQPHDRRAVLANMVMASNWGFMGYPMIEAALGADKIIYAVMYVTAFNAMCWTMGSYFYRGIGAVRPKKIITNPTIIAVLVGLVLLVSGLRLPAWLNSALGHMGNITTPAAMFVIGARLLGVKLSDLTDKAMLLSVGIRLIAVPLLVLVCVRAMGFLTPNVQNVLFLCSAMPCASLTGMQSDLYDCEPGFASRGIAISTAISLGTVSAMLMILAM